MKITMTKALKRYAIEKLGVAVDASIDVFRKTIASALVSQKLDVITFNKLLKEPSGNSGGTPVKKTGSTGKEAGSSTKTVAPKIDLEKITDTVYKRVSKEVADKAAKTEDKTKALDPMSTFGEAVRIQVKEAADRYERTKSKAHYPSMVGTGGRLQVKHPLAGRPASIDGRELYSPSQLDKAIAGAYFKMCLARQLKSHEIPRSYRYNEHDQELMKYAAHSMEWTGVFGGEGSEQGAQQINRTKLSDFQRKAIFSDNTSGGLNAVPVAFDDAIVLIPILYGELFPFVNTVPVSRGTLIQGASMINPTFTSNADETTAITAFNTASFMSSFNTAIHVAVAAIEIGRDFEEDTPVDIGSLIIQQYGFQALQWLDRVVAVGNGTTEPQGIYYATGTTVVNSDNGIGGPLTMSDYQGLWGAVGKAYRSEPNAVVAFISNDTTYNRSRQIPVGPNDQRRVFGLDQNSYELIGAPYHVENDIANNVIMFANLRRYRMYRRLGLNIQVLTEGKTLTYANAKAIVLRMRWGGQLELGGAAAVMPDAQA